METLRNLLSGGGKDLVPVIVTGLKDWKYPRIWKKEKESWHLLSHARNTEHDGYQVFCDDEGSFGAVFLVAADDQVQELKVSAGKVVHEGAKILVEVSIGPEDEGNLPSLLLGDPEADARLTFSYPEANQSAGLKWRSSEGQSLFYESDEGNWSQGGRVSPNQEDMDMEYWWRNEEEGLVPDPPVFRIGLAGTMFEDPLGERTWILSDEGWVKADTSQGEDASGPGIIAVQSEDGEEILCLVWPGAKGAFASGGEEIGVIIKPISFPLKRRYLLRGKVYLMEGDLEILRDRISKEVNIY